MLVLTRKVGEAIAIGDDIKVIIMQIKGKQVRIGIKASPDTVVHREEIFQRIKDENHEASRSQPESVDQASDEMHDASKKEVGKVPLKRKVVRTKD